ncbi:multidrug effflux MFS transporter [Mucilaginibacter xinganensis]|uniref:Bcr/CflA family drug resistance efflux transporter n=1 Tax=Mucilaginibacter xinganensis TaxID=1234841 RepID=A0A223NU45_9SPHI|nr:multidrug effflux MFS transporter [Mucilaginibacter xinganensis]ASU33393.1 Bcr/CflA family drug resistance efflux transporter [Mucilaginibacter xinganensis]
MTRKRYILLVLILGALTAIGPFSIDMYLPGFPAIAKSLHTTTARVSLSLSGFFIGISAGQLLYGPLLDRFGRKNPLYVGLILYIAASVGCFFVNTIEQLIVLRFIQAVGSCAAGVASMAMVRDIFPVKDNAKVFALLILILGVSPMIAPTVGGYVTAAFEWQYIFVILAGIAVIVLMAVIFLLPESHQPDPSHSLKPRPIINSFWTVIKHPQFYTYAICGAIGFSGLFAYLAASPFVFMDVYGVSSKVYGWIFALLSVGFIGSSQVNGMLTRSYKSEQIVNVTLPAMVLLTLVFIAGSALNVFGIYGTILMIFLILCCVGITYPNTSALSLAPFSKNAGTAAALMGALQMAFGTLVSIVVSMFKSRSTIPMAGLMATAALLALLILIIGRRNIVQPVEATDQVGVGAH